VIWKKSICLMVCIMVLVFCVSAQGMNGKTSAQELSALLGEKPEDIMKSEGMIPGDSTSDWTALILARNGWSDHREDYLNGIWRYVNESYQKQGGLDMIKATVWHRISLTVLALGADPTCFGEDANGDPIDLIAEGTYNWSRTDSLGTQGTNAWIYSLMVLDALDYEIPKNARYTRGDIINSILECQLDNGGSHIGSGAPEVDVTAMALQAIAPYYGTMESVTENVDRALEYLSSQQNAQGDFGKGGSESCAQVILALCALGIDPESDARFQKAGGSALDGLLLYHTGEGFSHLLGEKANTLSTQQAAQALTALDRLRNGESRLYDFTDQQIQPFVPKDAFPFWIVIVAGIGLAAIILYIRKGKKRCTV